MPSQTENKTFFNVMPEATSGPLSKPKVQTTTALPQTAAPKTEAVLGSTTQVKKPAKSWQTVAGLSLVAILILAGLGIGAFLWLSGDEETTIEIPENDKPAPQVQENPEVTTPGDWLNRFFGTETCVELVLCGDKADPDRDGLDNKAEFDTGTDPNKNDSDGDGIADGDEALVFNSDPLLLKTYREGEYNDAEFIKGGYDIQTNSPYTNERLLTIKSMIKQYGLHQPTLTTLGTLSFQLYEFTDPSLPPLPADLDVSPQAKLDRDSQRQGTIKKIGAALLAYKADKKTYPPTDDYVIMSDMVKPYNTVATNYNDPISREPYVYGYQATNNNTDFTLTYYSETQNQLIKYFAKDAEANQEKESTQGNDEQRKADIEKIRGALLVWSTTQLDPASDKEFVFPPADQLKSALVPRYLTEMPVDPITKLDYVYQVGPNFDTFSIKTPLQTPAAGSTGYMCDQTECKNY